MTRHATKLKLSAALLTSALLTVGLGGCNRTESAETLMAEAAAYQQKGDVKAALIQLKNAVANSPDNGEARMALGSLQLANGDAASAEKEFSRARALGVPSNRVLPLLGRAMNQQAKFSEVLNEITVQLAGTSAPLLTVRGDALLSSGKAEEARQAYTAALAADAAHGDALLGMARLAAASGDRDGAARYVEEAVAKDPKNPEVFMMNGSLLRLLNKPDEAVAAYDKALALKPDHRGAHIEKAYIEIARNNFDAAKKEVEAAEKNAPGNLLVVYTRGLYEFSQAKYPEAKVALQKILKAAPNHQPSILLTGATELNLGATQQAEQHLRKYLESNPENVYARKLLAQALLKNSQPADAVAVLAPALKTAPNDAQLLALAGESHMQVRDFAKASAYLEQAAKLAPGVAAVRTSLGLSKLAQGDQARGLNELELAATLDPKSVQATMALVQTEMSLKRYDKALAAVQTLEKQQPDNAQVHQMKGIVYMAQGNVAASRAALEKAVALQPTFLPAVTNLARLDLQENKKEAAKQRFTAFLEKDKSNPEAMAALAALAMQEKRPEEATTWLEKASDANPGATMPALRLGSHYLATGQTPKALNLARKFQTTHPTDPGVLELLGHSQVASKDLPGALETYNRLANVLPKSGMVHMRIANVQALMKNDTAAAASLKRAIDLQPNLIQARTASVELAVNRNRHAEALEIARDTQKTYPKLPIGYALEGDVHMFQRQAVPALAMYEKAFAIAPSTELMVKISEALGASGKAAEGTRRAAEWYKAHPNDNAAGHYLATTHLQKKEFTPAIAVLEGILKRNPQDAMALNNLAWTYGQTKDARAVPTAEKAVKIAGNSPAILDTLGWLLVEQGSADRGVPYLKKAAAEAPAALEISYHLAVGLAKSGDKDGARKELDRLLVQQRTFPQIEEARALRKTL